MVAHRELVGPIDYHAEDRCTRCGMTTIRDMTGWAYKTMREAYKDFPVEYKDFF